MTRVLLTGANGFVGSHILQCLLDNAYSVVLAVRSTDKAMCMRKVYPTVPTSTLDFVLVPDMCALNAFKSVLLDNPVDAVIHTASPFRFDVKDISKVVSNSLYGQSDHGSDIVRETDEQQELIDPAVNGTRRLLECIRDYSPTVKRFILTSSFAAIENPHKGAWPDHTYDETDWSPLTMSDALTSPFFGYLVSKKAAEQAAWSFVENNPCRFTLTSINPPMVFGPITPFVKSANEVNTSNRFFLDLLSGKHTSKLPETGLVYWADVHDVAVAHIQAMREPVAGERIIITAGVYCNKDICDILRARLPEYVSYLPPLEADGGSLPTGGVAKIDNTKSMRLLKMKYRSLEQSVLDVARSLERAGLVTPCLAGEKTRSKI